MASLVVVAHVFNPSLREAETEGSGFKARSTKKPCLKKKQTKRQINNNKTIVLGYVLSTTSAKSKWQNLVTKTKQTNKTQKAK